MITSSRKFGQLLVVYNKLKRYEEGTLKVESQNFLDPVLAKP